MVIVGRKEGVRPAYIKIWWGELILHHVLGAEGELRLPGTY